jgi:hypothetical protein
MFFAKREEREERREAACEGEVEEQEEETMKISKSRKITMKVVITQKGRNEFLKQTSKVDEGC